MVSAISAVDTKLNGGFTGVDKNLVPVGWFWTVSRVTTYDDGTVTTTTLSVPFTADDLTAHVSAALVAQAADIASDAAERDSLKAQLAEKTAALDAAAVQTAKPEGLANVNG